MHLPKPNSKNWHGFILRQKICLQRPPSISSTPLLNIGWSNVSCLRSCFSISHLTHSTSHSWLQSMWEAVIISLTLLIRKQTGNFPSWPSEEAANQGENQHMSISTSPCGPNMAKTPHSQWRGPRFDPWLGKKVPHATTKDPAYHN